MNYKDQILDSADNVCDAPTFNIGHEIGWAVKQMWNGQKVKRSGWNGKSIWLAIQVPDCGSRMTVPYVYMRTAQGDLVPWLASQTDLLAIDWGFAEV